MKTITEYQPLIFSKLAAEAERRSRQRRQLGIAALIVVIHSIIGLLLSFGTGFVVWNWQFWLMFAPLFITTELLAHQMHGLHRGKGVEESGGSASDAAQRA